MASRSAVRASLFISNFIVLVLTFGNARPATRRTILVHGRAGLLAVSAIEIMQDLPESKLIGRNVGNLQELIDSPPVSGTLLFIEMMRDVHCSAGRESDRPQPERY
jgi:hypothetical protein